MSISTADISPFGDSFGTQSTDPTDLSLTDATITSPSIIEKFGTMPESGLGFSLSDATLAPTTGTTVLGNEITKVGITGPTDALADLVGPERDAASALISMFESYGLGSLAPKIIDFIKQGFGSDTIALLLQDTTEYKQRFAANEVRRKAGLPVLSPAEYLATERAYRQALMEAGLPEGFYDSSDDFRKFLESDISPSEIKVRADIAGSLAASVDPAQRDFLAREYGLSQGDIAAYFLDTEKAVPVLERKARAIQIGSEAQRVGYVVNRDRAEYFASLGVSRDQAAQGFSFIQQNAEDLTKLGDVFDIDFGAQNLESEIFTGDAESAKKRKRLASQERAAFSGSSRAVLGDNAQGSF